MAIREFELFHGAVLTKLVRGERPVALRMIETRVSQAWSAYKVNDQLVLYVKHSSKPRKGTRQKKARTWQFTFSPDDISKIAAFGPQTPTYVVLACGDFDCFSNRKRPRVRKDHGARMAWKCACSILTRPPAC